MSLHIFPATDLHLVMGTAVDLRFFAEANGVFRDLATLPNFGMRIQDTTAFGVVARQGTRLTPTAVGSAELRVELSWDGRAQVRSIMRVTVHQHLRRLLVPRANVELETNRSDRVLTVYGEFEDGAVTTVADVTAHPYLAYAVTNTAGAPNIACVGGRVTTGAAVGSARVDISIAAALGINVQATAVDIRVAAPPADRPILERMHQGTALFPRAILFLSEGFTAAERPQFNRLTAGISRRLFQLSPMTLLRERFETYRAFVPSAESGATIGPPILTSGWSADVGLSLLPDQPLTPRSHTVQELIGRIGLPGDPQAPATPAAARARLGVNAVALPDALFDTWANIPTPRLSRLRETAFGLLVGARHGGARALQLPANAAVRIDVQNLDPRLANRSPIFDERRLPDLMAGGINPLRAHEAAFDAFLRTLRAADGPVGYGARWATGGDDRALVVILVNADHYGGLRLDSCITLSLGGGMQHKLAASNAVPGLVEVAPVPKPINLWSADHRLGFRNRPLASMADRACHELGHSAALGNLGDEYGGRRNPTPPAFHQFVESAPNTQMLVAGIRTPANGVNAARVKWNWPRAVAGAVVQTVAGQGQILTVGIDVEDIARWPNLAAGRALILRGRDLASNRPAPVTLTHRRTDLGRQEIELAVAAPDTAATLLARFQPGAVLLVPRLDAHNHVVTLIVPAVATELAAHGPFTRSGANCTPAPNPRAPAIPHFAPVTPAHLIAAYESAAEANCDVIRPTVNCKMRTVIETHQPPVGFCFACKYAIVDRVDPAAHGALDREYPR